MAFPLPVGSPSANPDAVDLEIYRTEGKGYIIAAPASDKIVFKVRKTSNARSPLTFLLTDAGNNPIFTLRKKWPSPIHKRWRVFHGDSIDRKHLFFKSAKSDALQRETELAISFANKEAEDDSLDLKKKKKKAEVVYDFKLKETSSHSSFTISSGDSSKIVAKGEKLKSEESGNLKVTIHPNADRAFVIAIIVIFDQMERIPFVLPLWPIMAVGNMVVAAVTES